jgi:hypothetical protein
VRFFRPLKVFAYMQKEIESGALRMVFWTALLVSGITRTAEAAVLDGIAACEDISHQDFIIYTVKSAIRRRAKSAEVLDGLSLLPPALRAVLMLQPPSRDCYVLRILVGLSPEVCAGLLDISIPEFQDALCGALNELPLLCSAHTWPIQY